MVGADRGSHYEPLLLTIVFNNYNWYEYSSSTGKRRWCGGYGHNYLLASLKSTWLIVALMMKFALDFGEGLHLLIILPALKNTEKQHFYARNITFLNTQREKGHNSKDSKHPMNY